MTLFAIVYSRGPLLDCRWCCLYLHLHCIFILSCVAAHGVLVNVLQLTDSRVDARASMGIKDWIRLEATWRVTVGACFCMSRESTGLHSP